MSPATHCKKRVTTEGIFEITVEERGLWKPCRMYACMDKKDDDLHF